jgi:DNA-binding NarL/FixJ family response regulator
MLNARHPPAGIQNRRRILTVEDHPLMREGIAAWINHDPTLEVCGEATTVSEALDAAKTLHPDLVLCDITLGDKNGLDFVRDLQQTDPDLPVVMLSMHDESVYALRALRAGARGYLMKRTGGSEIIGAIKEVLDGGTAFTPAVTKQLMVEYSGREHGRPSHMAGLTDREFEILQLFGRGKTNREIDRLLDLSPKTVESHRINIRQKLDLKSTAELIRYAVHCTERPPEH